MITRPNRRHSICVLTTFAISFALLCLATELWLPQRAEAFRDRGYSVRRDQLKQRLAELRAEDPSTPLVVMLGSSRVHGGLDGRLAEAQLQQRLGRKVCLANFGTPAGAPTNSMIVLGRLLRDGLVPDLLLVEAMPAHLHRNHPYEPGATPMLPADYDWLAQHGFPMEHEPQSTGPAIWAYRTDLLKAYFPKILPRVTATDWLRRTDAWGAMLATKPVTDEDRARLRRGAEETIGPNLRTFELGDKSVDLLRAIVKECHSRNIPTTIVLMPEGPEFKRWYRPHAREEVLSAIEGLAEETGSNFVSSWDWLDELSFYDSHHMVASGAAVFTKRLCDEAIANRLPAAPIARRAENSYSR